MSSSWTINREYRDTEAARAFATLDLVFALDGELISSGPLNRMVRVALDGRRFFVKRYTAGGKGLRRYFGRSRVRAEWENLAFFSSVGIPTPKTVAWGEERVGGLSRRGAIVTEEVVSSVNFAAALGTPAGIVTWRRKVNLAVADYLGRLHGRRFAHNDLKFRNVLVSDDATPRVYFIDCPTGRRWWGPFLYKRIRKDLALWDGDQAGLLSRTDRLRFYLAYAGKARLMSADKTFIRRVLSYYRGR